MTSAANGFATLVEKTFKKLIAHGRGVEAPYIAVLGPPGSGRRSVMRAIRSHLQQHSDQRSQSKHVIVNLSANPVFSDDEAHFRIINAIYDVCGVKRPNRKITSVNGATIEFELALRDVLDLQCCPVVTYLEELEKLPNSIIRSLGNTFRQILEKDDEYPNYHYFGLVWMGSVSFFQIKNDHDSAFTMCDPIILPTSDRFTKQSVVKSTLAKLNVSVRNDEVVDKLVEETAGEPGFLIPLINRLKSLAQADSLTPEAINNIGEELSDPTLSAILELRLLGFNLLLNKPFQKTVRRVLNGETSLSHDVTVDIDLFQLLGGLVLRTSERPFCYSIRNGIIRKYCSQVISRIERRGNINPRGLADTDLQCALESEHELGVATNIWDCLTSLERAWTRLTPYPKLENLRLFLTQTGKAQILQLSSANPSGLEPLDQGQLKILCPLTSTRIPRDHCVVIQDNELILFGVKTNTQCVSVWIMGDLPLNLLKSAVAEAIAQPWVQLIRNWRRKIASFALTAIGLDAVVYSLQTSQIQKDHPPYNCRSSTETLNLETNLILTSNLAIYRTPRATEVFKLTLDSMTIDTLDTLGQSVSSFVADLRDFKKTINSIGHHVTKAIEHSDSNLHAALRRVHDQHQKITITHEIEMLRFPIELYDAANLPLAIRLGVAREIIGYPILPELSIRLDKVLKKLCENKERLRAIIVAVAEEDSIELVKNETKSIKEIFLNWSNSFGVSPEIQIFEGKDASYNNILKNTKNMGEIDLFHFCGHAMANSNEPDSGGIILHDSQFVDCEKVRAMFEGANIRFVYLNACYSGAIIGSSNNIAQYYKGLIDAVLLAGVPNIVCFRWAISDKGACALSKAFYKSLFQYKDPASAMHKARKQIRSHTEGHDAWASPLVITNAQL